MTKIVLVLGIFPSEKYNDIITESKGNIQYAADALQKSFLEGIVYYSKSANLDISIINFPYIGSFPERYKRLFSEEYDFNFISQNGNIAKGRNIRFCNLKGYKMFSRYIHTKKELNKICSNSVDNVICIIYAIHSPFLMAAIDIKKKYTSKFKIIQIVPDLPEYMEFNEKNKISLTYFLRNQNQILLEKNYKYIDAFILLSKYMNEPLNITNQPWEVIEGIYNPTDGVIKNDKKIDKTEKIILYTGTLARKYGVENLVKAFRLIKNKEYKLVICGDGDYRNDLKEQANQDNRIIYKGQLQRKDILLLQYNADLLVNPRTNDGEYTKYSFPSKTMEYLASGTPTLLYKLPGIPEEYYNYCFTLEGDNINELSSKIIEILSMPKEKLQKIGANAQLFILKNKNPYIQCEKIFKLINKL